MPTETENYSPGTPVEIGQIGRELKKLWSESESSMTRASLINLAVYAEEPGALERNTQLIAKVTEANAGRAIVVVAEPRAKENKVETWISAHCHVRDGAKQVCSEQISFLLRGASCKMLPNIVFAQLDSDLPLYLWWQAPFLAPLDPQLWSWIDRLIYDSQTWDDFNAQWRLVETACEEARQRIVLCDLNWTRLWHFRLAFAQFFDHPASHHHFATLEKISITHGEGFRSTALLFAGWLAAQLKWRSARTDEKSGFKNASDRSVQMELRERGQAPLMEVTAKSGEVQFNVRRAACGDLLEVGRGRSGKKFAHKMLPAGSNEAAHLLSDELMRGGPHHVYLAAVAQTRELL